MPECNCVQQYPGAQSGPGLPANPNIGPEAQPVLESDPICLTQDSGDTISHGLVQYDNSVVPPIVKWYIAGGEVTPGDGWEEWPCSVNVIEKCFCVIDDTTGDRLKKWVMYNQSDNLPIGDPIYFDSIGNVVPAPASESPCEGSLLAQYGHDFQDAQVINSATLLGLQAGDGVHSVDIDVKESLAGVTLVRGGTTTVILPGGSRSWDGHHDEETGVFYPATDFTLTMVAGDSVVVSFSVINPV